ncbi:MAG: hypothetical protein K2X81_23690, partial [Candidatus Obscuribacterales bacterium]|nr:hypothetical protein [Candidatus Obscuribacterales bacterium]
MAFRSNRATVLLATLSAIFLGSENFCCHAYAAQDESLSNSTKPGIIDFGSQSVQDWSFDYFIHLVERNYPKLQSADAERRISSAKRLEKSGAFDPVINHVSEYLRVQDTFKAGVAKNAIHNESKMDLLTRSGIKVFAGIRLNPNDTKTPFVPTG